ncbi:MAG: peroxiredoxin [Chloroflexi bacterium]|nr:peroxiredoxin [Chloroflexota bacterium]HCU73859.1 peroxiredoxin [Chloroflexota bacterium]|tara:strand:+ start:249 stop:830 length:582 start_codon:yes stop_codon:yes gene_type:complete
MTSSNKSTPANLPIPGNDGACDHLIGTRLPDLGLVSTVGDPVNLSRLPERNVVYCYPMTGRPDVAPPEGWAEMPGAMGCTPQSCAFRDHYGELCKLGVQMFGLSTQKTTYQKEMSDRLRLPFKVLSDEKLMFSNSIRLPTFKFEGKTLTKRVTFVANNGVMEAVHYPVFPSDADPEWAINHLEHFPSKPMEVD